MNDIQFKDIDPKSIAGLMLLRWAARLNQWHKELGVMMEAIKSIEALRKNLQLTAETAWCIADLRDSMMKHAKEL